MTDARFRRIIIAIMLGGSGLLVLLGFIFWRTLPPVVNVAAAQSKERPFPGVEPLPSVIPRGHLDGIRVAILNEPENVRITAPGEYDSALVAWRDLVQRSGGTIVAPTNADVIVAPQAECLGPVQRRLVANHLAKGRGLVTTGAFGARDGICGPLRDTLLASLLGLPPGSIRPAVATKLNDHFICILGETALAAGVPAGARLELAPAKQITFRSPARDMMYTDYYRNTLDHGVPYYDGAALRAAVGSAHVVAFGYTLGDFLDKWSVNVGSLIAVNAIRWAARQNMYQLATWPHALKAAAVLAEDAEADFANSRDAVDLLTKYHMPGTEFVVGELAQADPVTTQKFIKAGFEIGTHTHHHIPLDTLSPKAELRELTEGKATTERLVGHEIQGMRPPEERYTFATLQDWADLGGSYVFANNNLRSATPEIIPMLPDSMVLLGRVSDDDFEILDRDHIRNRTQMVDRVVGQVGESVAFRGLYMFSYHSHMFAQKDLLPVLAALADKLKHSPEVWTTTAGAVASWWRERSHIQIEPTVDGSSASIVNTGQRDFAGGVLFIDTPDGNRRTVQLPVLGPGQSVRVRADGTPASTLVAAR